MLNKLTAGSLTLMTVPSSFLVANNMVPSKRYSPFSAFSPSLTRVFLILVTSSSGLKSTLCWIKLQLGLFWIWKYKQAMFSTVCTEFLINFILFIQWNFFMISSNLREKVVFWQLNLIFTIITSNKSLISNFRFKDSIPASIHSFLSDFWFSKVRVF